MSEPAPSTLRRDLISAYVVSATRIASWAAVTAIVFRELGEYAFGLLALIRGTIGLMSYTMLGLSPAMIHLLAKRDHDSHRAILSSGLRLVLLGAGAGLLMLGAYAWAFDSLHSVPDNYLKIAPLTTFWMGLGILFRLCGDPASAVLQVRHRIALDNILLASAEAFWAIGVGWAVYWHAAQIDQVAAIYAGAGLLLLAARWFFASRLTRTSSRIGGDWKTVRTLLAFGVMVVLAQLADYLYAPTDYILINRLLGPQVVAAYAPAVQIDAGLLVLVGGLAAVLLPKAALAHAAGDSATVRRYYLRGTFISTLLLLMAAVAVWLIGPRLLERWLGNPMPETVAILPLVLIHTVIGGSSAVGRSILLGMGKVKAFTAAVLIGGAANVILSFLFVYAFNLGLAGIVYGTVLAVVGRCAIWMPWYVLRSIGQSNRIVLSSPIEAIE
ncbi:MAG: oligosaccharide flippase family protein [Phycisphaerales bacterium]|nr:oligosaccharide flippase family protein [Phycisphaerales bacterium]